MFDRYEDDFSWLVDAAVVLPTYSVTEPKRPLLRTAQRNRFKLYESDTGLLLSQYPPQATLDVIANAASVNFGSVYENAVAQALVCENPHLYYFHHSRKREVDFIVERDDGSLLPIEVKSGKDYKLHTALNNLSARPISASGRHASSPWPTSAGASGRASPCGTSPSTWPSA